MSHPLRASQEAIAFSTPEGLPLSDVGIRSLPTSGTNMSFVFGEQCLGALDLTEEQLELLESVRFLPETLLTKHIAAGTPFETVKLVQRELKQKADTAVRLTERCAAQCRRSLSEEQFRRILEISIAERSAGRNSTYFAAYCQNLRRRFSSLGKETSASIEVLFNQVERFSDRAAAHPPCDLVQVLYGNVNSPATVQQLLDTFQPLAQQSIPFGESEFELLVSNSKAAKDAYLDTLQIPGRSSETLGPFLQSQMTGNNSTSTETSWRKVSSDVDIFRFLFGLTTTRDLSVPEMSNLIYLYITDHTVRNLTATPAELVLQPLLSGHMEAFASALLQCTLLDSFIWRFTQNRDSLLAVCQLSETFRTLSRVNELLGITVSEPYRNLAQYLEQILPHLSGYTSHQSVTMEEIATLSEELVTKQSDLQCWSFASIQKPWMPLRERRSLNMHGPLGITRADTVLKDFRDGDFWLYFKWAGVDIRDCSEAKLRELSGIELENVAKLVQSELGSKLLTSLLRHTIENPTHNTRVLMSLLAISDIEMQLFVNKEDIESPQMPVVSMNIENGDDDDGGSSEEWPELF